MSWPTWSATPTPIPVQSTLLPTGINSAPAVMPPGLQYSPEQWAQAQQQNWQQWAQWQQQYQQWHQQYGAEYQKSMSAIQGAIPAAVQQPPLPGMSGMPNTGVPPPLPTENKPPLPPEEPPSNQPSLASYTTLPPKQVQGGYSTAPPPLMTQQLQMPQQMQSSEQYGNQRQNWQIAQGNPNKRPFTQGPDYENAKRPLMERPNQWGNQKPSGGQWQTQPPQNVSYHTQPPPKVAAAPKPNIEELSEAEKKFDKEFAAWEAQFNKWKDQNANHPDKTQYREYEKKWESWRNSLLERREQMRKKRLALTNVPTNKPFGFNQSSSQPQLGDQTAAPKSGPLPAPGLLPTPALLPTPSPKLQSTAQAPAAIAQVSKPSITDNSSNNPPPHQNNEPLSFKPSAPGDFPSDETSEHTGEDFLKPSFSSGSGIPGLDLVKEGEENDNEEKREDVVDLERDDKNLEKPDEQPALKRGPDFDAISKGINSILGDQKLLSMLSMVSQNPPAASASNTITDSLPNITSGFSQGDHNFSAPPPPHQFNEAPPSVNFPPAPYSGDQSNHSYEDKSNQGDNYQQRESVNNFDDQTRSSFTMGPSDQDVAFNGNNLSRNQNNKFPPARFSGPPPEANRNFGPSGESNFGANVLENRNKFGPNRGDFRPGGFTQEPSSFNQADSLLKRNEFGSRPPGSFPQDQMTFNQGNSSLTRNEFGRGVGNFPQDPKNFGNQGDIKRGEFGRGSGNFAQGDFNRGNNFNRNESFNRNDNFGGNFNRGGNDFQNDRFGQENNANRRGGNFRHENNYGSGNNSFEDRRGGGLGFDRTDNFNQGNEYDDNYNDGGEDYKEPGDYDDYENYNEEEDFDKYHNMFNDDDQDFQKPSRTQSHPPGRRMDLPPPRRMDQLPPAIRMDQFAPARRMDLPPPNRGMELPPPNRGMDLPPPNRGMDLPPPSRLMDLPLMNRNMNLPPPTRGMDPSPGRINEPPPVITPEPPSVEEAIFEPTTVIDYDHKPLRPADPDVVVEPIYMFDYRHKPLNRIPLPQRPKWLSESVKFIREFDPLAARATLNFERPPPLDRYIPISRDMRRDDRRPDIEDRYIARSRNFEERERRHLSNYDSRIERRPFSRDDRVRDDRGRDDRDRDDRGRDDRDDRGRDDRDRDDRDRTEPRFERDLMEDDDRNRRRFNENDRFSRDHNSEGNSRNERRNSRGHNDFEELSDDDMDFESGEVQKHHQNRGEKSRSRSPILSNPPNPANFSEVSMIEDIINPPGRFNRPPRIVIILRGPPGSGKTFLAKLIKDKEVENGGSAPRILSLDDYFMVEHEKEVVEDGKTIKVKEMVYEYEAEMEESYRTSFLKSFKKTITDGYFPFIIVDNVNDKVKHFGEMWSFAKQNGFQVYICQMDLDPVLCTKRNIHNRNEAEIEECIAGWEPTPNHHPSVDASGLLQTSAISDVEMEEVEQKPEVANLEEEPEPSSMESANRCDRPEPWKSTSNWKMSGNVQNQQSQARRGFGGPIWRSRGNRRR